MALGEALREHKDTLLRGVSFLVGGAALVLVGSLIGVGTGKVAMISAGTLAIAGVIVMFLGFFLYLLPPMLPGR